MIPVHPALAAFCMTSAPRFSYDRERLLQISSYGQKIPCKLKRRLWYFGLFRAPFAQPLYAPPSVPQSSPIPVRITSRSRSHRNCETPARRRCLVRPPIECVPRKRKSKTRSDLSILYFNARSLKNKVDELSIRCKRHNPDLVVITESWLDSSVPDSYFSLENYVALRCDRNSNGGGIVLFIRQSIFYQRVSMNDVPNVKSNILCCILPELSIVLFCIYHPYWGNSSAHNSVLDSLQDFFDRLLLSHGSNLQMVLCGDVNGLTKHLSPFLLTNGLSQLITFCTREENIIDIFALLSPLFTANLCASPH